MRNRSALTTLALTAGLGLSACSGETTPVASTATSASTSAEAATSAPAAPTASASASTKSSESPAPAPATSEASAPQDAAPAEEKKVETAVAPAPGDGGSLTDEEAYHAYRNGQLTQAEYCARSTFFAPEDAQQCFKFQYPDLEQMPHAGPREWGMNPPQYTFTYDEAYAAWQSGMAYYDAFCLNYTPVTEAGISQCAGIRAGTVDGVTGEYIGG